MMTEMDKVVEMGLATQSPDALGWNRCIRPVSAGRGRPVLGS
jgi:hypothetical protein